ncbi:DUF3866 family protein [Tissierella sp. MB52-C2]|uniref:DUF3866 family protein n=1 Tax=Tissierella sp. MB52-C2 TaxID=3070999 RepID=UPI00280AF80B|nr:DUF3866 family protein [Tissierella sp. MB52-C2]WMM26478.1 DUF3866 family protein [Tissierella sp. MB52-C2]
MISYKSGIVKSIINDEKDITTVNVNVEGEVYKAVNYKDFTGEVNVEDEVVLNTTAVDLSLGTGGYHFIIYNHKNKTMELKGPGHIMKLRYTPYQMSCLVAEEEDSPYHHIFNDFKSLDNHIFIVATLHSMVAPIAAMIKYMNKDLRINYMMTDGGALPMAFSNTIRDLKGKEILDKTITVGHAFGGDLETINIYTGLIAAKEILKGDITIISMGPGIVGSGTKYGFTGMEQGYIIDAINNLGGLAVAVPRISFKDLRERHKGISHHTITVLSQITNTKANVVLPYLEEEKEDYLKEQIDKLNIKTRHNIIFQDGEDIQKAMEMFNLKTSSMGRTIKDDIDYFISLGAVGQYVASLF